MSSQSARILLLASCEAELLAGILAQRGHQVSACDDPGDARARMAGFDLLLLDAQYLHDPTLLADLRCLSLDAEVVLLASRESIAEVLAAVRDGAFGYLLRPFRPEDVITVTDAALRHLEVRRQAGRLQQALERSERLSRKLVDTADILFVGLDVDGRIVLWNRKAEEVTGFSRQEILHRPAEQWGTFLTLPGTLPEAPRLREHLACGRVAGTTEAPLLAADGRQHTVRWHTACVRAGDGRVEMVFGIGEDVTEAREIAHRHKMRDEMVRTILENSADAILALDPSGRIIEWNHGAEQIYGYSRDEILGRTVAVLIPPDLLAKGDLAYIERAVEEQGALRSYETDRLTKDGRRIRVSLTRTQLRDAEGRILGSSAVVRDVTSQRQLERRARQAEQLAAVGTLAAGLAHEIRNPLGSAELQLRVLEKRLRIVEGELPDRQPQTPALRAPLELVRQELRRLNSLVTDFLDFARPRPLDLAEGDVHALLEGVAALCGPEAKAAGIAVETATEAGLPASRFDAERMKQVLLNLVRNGLEAMTRGGRLVLRGRREGQSLALDVEDTGPGLSDPRAPIFEAFYSTKQGGTGLGLAIAKRIVADHAGDIRVTSGPGGTVFTLILPPAAAAAAATTATRMAEAALASAAVEQTNGA